MFSVSIFSLDYEKVSNQILNKCSKEVEKRYPITVMGTGGSGAHDIQTVHIKYQYDGEADIAEARKIYIGIAEVFIQAYKASKELRPYLHTYPFNEKHLSLYINFKNPKNEKVSFVGGGGDKNIEYYRSILNTFRSEIIFVETYQAALEIVKNEHNADFPLKDSFHSQTHPGNDL